MSLLLDEKSVDFLTLPDGLEQGLDGQNSEPPWETCVGWGFGGGDGDSGP